VDGDIQARRLSIKEGGQVDGKISMMQPAPREPAKQGAVAAATPT
jgi:cytoskeletal protein CcmA (bactofilin family)